MTNIPLLIISGPCGVGKTTIAGEVSDQLTPAGIAHTFIDLDGLAGTYPRPADDRFGTQLALANLRDVWSNCFAAGSCNLIVARVIETPEDLQAIVQSVPGAAATVCQLTANDATLLHRVRQRELGSSLVWHESRTTDLARQLRESGPMDFSVDTENRAVVDIGADLVAQVRWAI